VRNIRALGESQNYLVSTGPRNETADPTGGSSGDSSEQLLTRKSPYVYVAGEIRFDLNIGVETDRAATVFLTM